jgi:manganese/zinc/iron transport system substrate-binding protein
MVLRLILAGLLVSGFLLGCGPASGDDSATASKKYTVVCTVGMVADVVRHVAGDHANVIQLMEAGIDPHGYKPTRDDIVRLQQADIIFYSGLLLEGKLASTLTKLAEAKRVHAVTDDVPRDKLLSPESAHGEADPHVWMDASLWANTAHTVARKLGDADPANAQTYHKNAEAYAQRCRELHEWGKQVMATVPADQRLLVTSHDAFNYFGRAYQVDVMGVQGISTESEANVRDINQLVDTLVSRKVKAVFVESSVAPKNLQAVIEGAKSRGHTVAIGGELFSDAMGTTGTYEGTYLGMIDHNITTVVKALGGQVADKGWQGKLK